MIPRRLIANAIAARLVTITHATGYYGQVGRPLPGQDLIEHGGTIPPNPPTKSDDDLRVRPYFVFWPGNGVPTDEEDLADTHDDLVLPVRLTVAAGDIEDLLALIDRIHGALFRWVPSTDEGAEVFQQWTEESAQRVVCGPLRTPLGATPGPVLVDDSFTPVRLYVPLQYQLTATT